MYWMIYKENRKEKGKDRDKKKEEKASKKKKKNRSYRMYWLTNGLFLNSLKKRGKDWEKKRWEKDYKQKEKKIVANEDIGWQDDLWRKLEMNELFSKMITRNKFW